MQKYGGRKREGTFEEPQKCSVSLKQAMNSSEIPQYTILKWSVSNTVPDTYGRYSKTASMFMCLINEFKTGQKE